MPKTKGKDGTRKSARTAAAKKRKQESEATDTTGDDEHAENSTKETASNAPPTKKQKVSASAEDVSRAQSPPAEVETGMLAGDRSYGS